MRFFFEKSGKECPLTHVIGYAHGAYSDLTLEERMGEGWCECGHNDWILLSKNNSACVDGGKPYIKCKHCGAYSHL